MVVFIGYQNAIIIILWSVNMKKNVLDFKKYAAPSSAASNVCNDGLSKQLKKEQDIFINAIIKLEENEEILKLIENNKSIPSKLSKTPTLDGVFGFIGLVFLIVVGMCIWEGEWSVAFGWFIIFSIIGGVFDSYIKKKTKKITIKANTVLNKELDESTEKLSMLLDELLPEIHELGLFDVENVKNKTSAKLLNLDFIQSIIIDRELDEGRVEKIQFTDQKSKKSQILYKSLITEADSNDDMEHIELQID